MDRVFSKQIEKKLLFLKGNLRLQQILPPGFNRLPAVSCLNLSVEIGTAQLSDFNE